MVDFSGGAGMIFSMKNIPVLFAALSIAALSAPAVSHAKIGEPRSDIEGRLLSKIGGAAYAYDSREERYREAMELPYANLFLTMPRSVFHKFYYKRADSASATNSDTIQQHDLFGWEIHIGYNNDVSAMEFYRRHGDPITAEELEALMESVAGSKNSKWKKTTYVPVSRRWDIEFKNGAIKLAEADPDGKKALREILPENPNRFVYIELPEDVAGSTNYGQSLQFQIMEAYQRAAYEKYRKLVEKQSTTSAAKTARANSKKAAAAPPPKINKFGDYNMRDFESLFQPAGSGSANDSASIVKYKMKDVVVGGSARQNRTKNVQITYTLPQQPETMLGYDYELADGSVRVKLYYNGVLFVDSAFDKAMRANLEQSYKKQAEKRAAEAKESVGKF